MKNSIRVILINKATGNMLSTGSGPFNGRKSFLLFSSKTDRTLTKRLSGSKLNSSLFISFTTLT